MDGRPKPLVLFVVGALIADTAGEFRRHRECNLRMHLRER